MIVWLCVAAKNFMSIEIWMTAFVYLIFSAQCLVFIFFKNLCFSCVNSKLLTILCTPLSCLIGILIQSTALLS